MLLYSQRQRGFAFFVQEEIIELYLEIYQGTKAIDLILSLLVVLLRHIYLLCGLEVLESWERCRCALLKTLIIWKDSYWLLLSLCHFMINVLGNFIPIFLHKHNFATS